MGYISFFRGGSAKLSIEFYILRMDKNWKTKSGLSKEYEDGVELFLNFTIDNDINPKIISCLCTKCGNFQKMKEVDVKGHLYSYGIDMLYKN